MTGADRYVTGDVGHVVVNACVQRSENIGIRSVKPHTVSLMLSERRNGTLPNGVARTPDSVPANEALDVPYAPSTPTTLASKHRRFEHIAWHDKTKVRGGLQGRVQICRQVRRDPANLELARKGHVGAALTDV